MKTNATYLFLFLALLLATPACNTSKAVKGGAAGGVVGGVIGGAVGGTKGAVIGAIAGGASGAVIGDYMDKQAKEIEEEVPDARVEKVMTTDDEGNTVTESIVVTFDSGILFGFNSAELSPAVRAELQNMANIFFKYQDTDISIEGHTDSKGTEEYNQDLSEKRAAKVADYFTSARIPRSRMTVRGFGEMQPVASNETETGRAQNRRVEVSIKGNENLQRKAESGELVVPE